MTVLSSLLFSCFQAFSAALARPVPLFRPPFVTNLLRQPVSDLFQFYAAFSLPSRLISFSVTFSLPSRLIPFSVTFSLPSRLISFSVTFSLPSRLIPFSDTFSLPYCLIPFSVTFSLPYCLIPFFAAFSPLSRLILDFFRYFQCIYNTFSLYFPRDHSVRISCMHQKYLFHHQMLL